MKTTILGLALAATAACMLPMQNAKAASDFKGHAGSECKVFGATAWTDLQYGARGLTNLASSARNVICPLVIDDDAAAGAGGGYDGAQATVTHTGYAHIHMKSGPNTQVSSCQVLVADDYGNLLNTYTVSGFGGVANTQYGGLESSYVDSTGEADHTQLTLLCTLAPGARLQSYYWYETGTTNTP